MFPLFFADNTPQTEDLNMDQLAFPEADISSKSNCFYSTDLQAQVFGGLPVAEKMNMSDNALYVSASYPIADMAVKG